MCRHFLFGATFLPFFLWCSISMPRQNNFYKPRSKVEVAESYNFTTFMNKKKALNKKVLLDDLSFSDRDEFSEGNLSVWHV